MKQVIGFTLNRHVAGNGVFFVYEIIDGNTTGDKE